MTAELILVAVIAFVSIVVSAAVLVDNRKRPRYSQPYYAPPPAVRIQRTETFNISAPDPYTLNRVVTLIAEQQQREQQFLLAQQRESTKYLPAPRNEPGLSQPFELAEQARSYVLNENNTWV